MKKNGFTLVELLAVIAILIVLVTLITPNLINLLKDKKEKLYEMTISEITRVSSEYVTSKPELLEDSSFSIELETLCVNKYIDCPIIDIVLDFILLKYKTNVLLTNNGEGAYDRHIV